MRPQKCDRCHAEIRDGLFCVFCPRCEDELRGRRQPTPTVWHRFPDKTPWPYKLVVVAIPGDADGNAPAVGVGYIKNGSQGPYFIVPGARMGFTVEYWADVFDNDFQSPHWHFPGLPVAIVAE